MKLSEISGHQRVIQHLHTAFHNNRIPSAYLFTGAAGIGKSTLATAFAKMLNCHSNDDCHQCDNCRMFETGSHPDFLLLKPDGQFIRIKQIQELIEQLSLKPIYAQKRVVVIEEAHRMNPESANCFLKILEEPPLDTLIILITTDENLLLETILSRTQKIQFAPLHRQELSTILSKNFELNDHQMEFLLNFSQGRVRTELVKKLDQMIDLRDHTVRMLQSLITDRMVEHCDLLEQWIKQDLQQPFLEFCSCLLRDWIFLIEGKTDQLYNQDIHQEISNIPRRVTIEQLQWGFDLIVETELAIKANAGKALALESLIIQLKQIFHGKIVV